MKRREFVGLVVVGSAIPIAIASCTSPTKETATSISPRTDGYLAVGSIAELNTKGQILANTATLGKVLIIADPSNSKQVIAVNPTCTHAGCTVGWEKEQKIFNCPCHDAKFASNGKVLEEPADRPLPTYLAKVEGDTILVKTI
jgi:cytochrome b6-f complex iron-sulfur subunit